MKCSELKGRAVVNLEDARKVGTIEDLMVDAESQHFVSINVRTGMFHAGGLFSKAQEFVDTPGVRYGKELITLPAELLHHPN